ncbi:hypothetical protein Tco_1040887 [Tanacetum coccineum]|uniref:Uncharacterized protein n=1 Tax=Tanacetum coccineum TaxID=301880 RepID=A0ABQ5GEM5_9ASTR
MSIVQRSSDNHPVQDDSVKIEYHGSMSSSSSAKDLRSIREKSSSAFLLLLVLITPVILAFVRDLMIGASQLPPVSNAWTRSAACPLAIFCPNPEEHPIPHTAFDRTECSEMLVLGKPHIAGWSPISITDRRHSENQHFASDITIAHRRLHHVLLQPHSLEPYRANIARRSYQVRSSVTISQPTLKRVTARRGEGLGLGPNRLIDAVCDELSPNSCRNSSDGKCWYRHTSRGGRERLSFADTKDLSHHCLYVSSPEDLKPGSKELTGVRDNVVRADAAGDRGGESVDTTAVVKDVGEEKDDEGDDAVVAKDSQPSESRRSPCDP